ERLNTGKSNFLGYSSKRGNFAKASDAEVADRDGGRCGFANADAQDDSLLVGGVLDGRTRLWRLPGRWPKRKPAEHGGEGFALPQRIDQLAGSLRPLLAGRGLLYALAMLHQAQPAGACDVVLSGDFVKDDL